MPERDQPKGENEMLIVMMHGGLAERQAQPVHDMVQALNERYPNPAQTVDLWFVMDDYAGFTPAGPEYAILDTDEPQRPKIHVAIVNRKPEQIAGLIAFQYARFLQTQLGLEINNADAAVFAMYMAGKDEEPPQELIEAYDNRRIEENEARRLGKYS